MHAYYEIDAEIPANHQINLKLPDYIPIGRAKIAIVYELPEPRSHKNTGMADFLDSLPDNLANGLSREEIKSYIDQERQSWND